MEHKNSFIARFALIAGCAAVAITCLYTIGKHSDPLARYTPQISEAQKQKILEYLTDDDINYIIDAQLEPQEFIDFIDIPGFSIHNAKLYTVAMDTQEDTKENIVNFVNKYRSHFSRTTLKNLLKYYNYTDLVNFYETEQVLNPNLRLVDKPDNPYLVLSKDQSVYKYAPEGLVDFDNIQVQPCMVEDLKAFMLDYESTLNRKITFLNGYNSYANLVDDFRIRDESTPYVDRILHTAGSNEEQLGYTVILTGQDEWLASCIEHIIDEDLRKVDYNATYDALPKKLRDSISWIEDNAYHYGFVIRYTEAGEPYSNLWYQPFLLRYVGKKTAKEMHNGEFFMETMNFSKELK